MLARDLPADLPPGRAADSAMRGPFPARLGPRGRPVGPDGELESPTLPGRAAVAELFVGAADVTL